ncbi:MAG TPA: hypothetical protein VF466_00500 [Candidatus Saccharimonadales bacterium]
MVTASKKDFRPNVKKRSQNALGLKSQTTFMFLRVPRVDNYANATSS